MELPIEFRVRGSRFEARSEGKIQTKLLQKSILKTLAYGAVFNYPLTADEIWKYLIVETEGKKQEARSYPLPVTRYALQKSLQFLREQGLIGRKDGYYFLSGMDSGVIQRKNREKIATKKNARALKFVNFVKYIKTVKLVGISGSLAMNNADADDDIDLFIIARKGTAWTTRVMSVALAEAMGMRRRPEVFYGRDKLCLNMFVDEAHMGVPEEERDLFSAHEVVQMVPIYEKDGTYKRFLRANLWVNDFLPNSCVINYATTTTENIEDRVMNSSGVIYDTNSVVKIHLPNAMQVMSHKSTDIGSVGNSGRSIRKLIACYSLLITEAYAKRVQLKYMNSRRTNEIISDGYLRFHPIDARRIILRRYSAIQEFLT